MEVQSVFTAREKIHADAACEQLRAKGIRCDTFETPWQNVPLPGRSTPTPSKWDVVVAPEDEDRARAILSDWTP